MASASFSPNIIATPAGFPCGIAFYIIKTNEYRELNAARKSACTYSGRERYQQHEVHQPHRHERYCQLLPMVRYNFPLVLTQIYGALYYINK
jgi:hypothetical protein